MPAREIGMSLTELMVAMALGVLLVSGALAIYGQGRASDRTSEIVARLQEQARYALSVIEADAELAGFYGFTNSPRAFRLVAGGNPDAVLAFAPRMRQEFAAVAGIPAGAHSCGANFAVDLMTAAQGSNGVFELGRNRAAGCNPYSSGAAPGSDTLTLRHASTAAGAPQTGRLQIFSSRLGSVTGQLLFVDGIAPGAVDADHRVLDLVVRTYYIARDSVSRPGFPALRVKSLTTIGGAPAFDEDEVMTGIEDLQVEFGIDTGDRDNDGVPDPDSDGDRDGVPDPSGRVTRYVAPDFPDLARYPVSAVRIWLRVRADEAEAGFVDSRVYRYAGVEYSPAGAARAYRRALLSRTIALRNARIY